MKNRSMHVGGIAIAALLALVPVAAQRGGGAPAPQQNVPTPRAADGHPDLSGFWGGGGGGGVKPDEKGNIVQLAQARLCRQTQIDAGECAPGVNAERDAGMT